MLQIRRGTFETNSSSTHSLAIPKEHKDYHNETIHFNYGMYGWEFESVSPADYLYTALLYLADDELLAKLKEILAKYNITATFAKPSPAYGYYDSCGIDHCCELYPFITTLFSSEELLLGFIFDGLVFTGNDNCEDIEAAKVYVENKTYRAYDSTTHTYIEKPNPYYKQEYDNYLWYYKEN